MKTQLYVAALTVCALLAPPVQADHHSSGDQAMGYFDAEDCELCSVMGKKPQLMQGMQWEAYKTDSGMVMLATAPKGMEKQYHDVSKEMMAAAEKVGEAGMENAKLCGFCTALDQLLQQGAKMQEIETERGSLSIMTADDPSVVKKIHAEVDKMKSEMEKMAKQMAQN